MNDVVEYIYIYRRGKSPRNLRLHREVDWMTGLSFSTRQQTPAIRFRIQRLREAGYVVRLDGGQRITHLFTDDPFLVDGEVVTFGDDHVTVYLPDRNAWDAWHAADKLTISVEGAVSAQAQRLFDLRERDE